MVKVKMKLLDTLRSWLRLGVVKEEEKKTEEQEVAAEKSLDDEQEKKYEDIAKLVIEDVKEQPETVNQKEAIKASLERKLEEKATLDKVKLRRAIKEAQELEINKNFAFSNKTLFESSGILDVDSLYPHSTKMYEQPERLKAFVFEWEQLIDNQSIPVEMKFMEIARVLEVFQRRSTITAGYIRDKIQELSDTFYYRMFLEASERSDNYVMSMAATRCMRQNNHVYEVAKHLATIVQDETLEEQTRIEMADNLELNCPFPEQKEIGTKYINEVVGEERSWRQAIPIRETGTDLPQWLLNALPSLFKKEKNRAQSYQDRLVEAYKNAKARKQRVVPYDPDLMNVVYEEHRSRQLEMEVEEVDDEKEYDGESEYVVEKVKEDQHIYDSSQNVHKSKINDVVMAKLALLEKDIVADKSYFAVMGQFIEEITKANLINEDDEDIVRALVRSITRISTDASRFDSIKLSLSQIFQRVFFRILKSVNKEELLQRMIEELVDTAEFCSTGYVSRLVNILSGFGDDDLAVLFKADQIRKDIKPSLLMIVKDSIESLKDEDLKWKLHERLMGDSNFDDTTTVQQFVNENLSEWQRRIQAQYASNVFDEVELRKLLRFVDDDVSTLFFLTVVE